MSLQHRLQQDKAMPQSPLQHTHPGDNSKEAQHAYANRQAAGDQRSGRFTGRGRGERGWTNGRTRAYINNVDVTDPHRNFAAAEWEKLGTVRRVV